MKDIDFDELDRAVGSALQGNPDYATVQKAAADDPAPVSDEVPETRPTAPAASLVQKRSSGRFMDVVHPSSDMKAQRQPLPVVARTAPRVDPISSQKTTLGEAPEVTAATSPLATPSTEHDDAAPVLDAYAQPDPLDFHNFSLDTKAMEDSHQEGASESTPPQAATKDDTAADDERELALERAMSELHELDSIMKDEHEMPPLDTPFVGDLAVEKRPLGAFSIDSLAEEATDDVVSDAQDAPTAVEDNAIEMDGEPALSTPAEVVEVQEKEQVAPVEPDVTTEKPSIEEASVVPEELENNIIAIESRAVEMPTGAAAGMGSIPQQYKESVVAKNTETTPVFDTAEYHRPLKHAEKKKAGWLRVAMIVFLIVLGVGAGVAVYYFDLLRFIG